MAQALVISECPRTPQSEVWARSYGVLNKAQPRDSAQLCECCGEGQHTPVRDNTPQGVTPKSSNSLEGRNSVNTYSNGASEESIGIYAKSRCQWSGFSMNLEPGP